MLIIYLIGYVQKTFILSKYGQYFYLMVCWMGNFYHASDYFLVQYYWWHIFCKI